MSNTEKHIAILGGGPCGLYAGRVLSRAGYKVTVLDKGIRPGGLAAAVLCGENWYDIGVHMLHSFDQEIFEDIKEIMEDERIEVELDAKIRWAGSFYRYPLQFKDLIKGVPFFKLCWQALNLFGVQFLNYVKPWTPKNAEEALIQLYGKPLYTSFFKDFTHRYWEIHPRELSATFVSTKMPRLTAVDVLKRVLTVFGVKERATAVESALLQETLHYSRTGAEAMTRRLSQAIVDAGGEVIQEADVYRVNSANNRVVSVSYKKDGTEHTVQCDECISTVPIEHLAQSMMPACSEDVLHAAKSLRHKPIAVYGLLVKKEKCLDALYVYYRDRVFHRVGEPKNAGMTVTPEGHTVLIVEMTCEVGDSKWRGEESIKSRIYADLEAEGICKRDDIVELYLNHYENGYPIFALGFEPYLEKLKNYVDSFENLQSVGRQGGFTYPNMHKAMRMGWDAADKAIERLKVEEPEQAEEVI